MAIFVCRRNMNRRPAVGKKAGNGIVPSAEEVKQARRSAVRLRKLARRRPTSAVRSIMLEGEEEPDLFELLQFGYRHFDPSGQSNRAQRAGAGPSQTDDVQP
jgi:hypothetical protein